MHKMLRLRVYGCRNLGKIIWLSMGKIIAGLQGMCFSNFSMNALITIIIIISQFLISLNPPANSS